MANLVIANVCSADCAYCFAASYLAGSRAASPAFMSREEFCAGLDYLDRSAIPEARLLGGEPTLHPQFAELVHLARERGKQITVFTHGGMPEAALASLAEIPTGECNVIVNMSATFGSAPGGAAAAERRLAALRRLGPRAMPGYTIQTPAFDLTPLFRVIQESGVRPVIRLGMALPGPQGSNRSLHPKQYPLVGSQIARQAKLAARQGIRLDFDCGFVRCMFTDAEREALQRTGMLPTPHCGPVVDLCPGGLALHCFSLSDHFAQTFSPQSSSADLRRAFQEHSQGYRTAGVYRECSACRSKAQGECTGGCLAATLRRFQAARIHYPHPPA